MLTFTCPNCGTVTMVTVGPEKKPHKPEMETKTRPDGYEYMWKCQHCEHWNKLLRLTCEHCHKGQ